MVPVGRSKQPWLQPQEPPQRMEVFALAEQPTKGGGFPSYSTRRKKSMSASRAGIDSGCSAVIRRWHHRFRLRSGHSQVSLHEQLGMRILGRYKTLAETDTEGTRSMRQAEATAHLHGASNLRGLEPSLRPPKQLRDRPSPSATVRPLLGP